MHATWNMNSFDHEFHKLQSALRVPRAVTWLTVYRPLSISDFQKLFWWIIEILNFTFEMSQRQNHQKHQRKPLTPLTNLRKFNLWHVTWRQIFYEVTHWHKNLGKSKSDSDSASVRFFVISDWLLTNKNIHLSPASSWTSWNSWTFIKSWNCEKF